MRPLTSPSRPDRPPDRISPVERRAGVAICAVAAIVYPLFWWAHGIVGPEGTDPLWLRLVIAAFAAWGAWLLSRADVSNRRLTRVHLGLVYLITTHLFVLLTANDLAWEYIAGMLILLLAMNAEALLGYGSARELDAYLLFVLAGIGATSLLVDDPAVPVPFFALALGTATVVSHIGLGAQLKRREELRRSRRRYRTVLDGAPIVFWSTDAEGRVIEIEGRGLEGLGVERGRILGRPLSRLLVDGPDIEAALRRAREGESVSATVQRPEAVFETWHAPMYSPDGSIEGTVGVATDVTDLHRMGEKLRQAQKMEAIGLLAGGIAHDFNNILTAVIGHAQLALDHAPEGGPLAESLDEIRSASERAAGLVRQLLAFSRQQALAPREIDLNDLVRSTISMMRPMIGEDIVLETRLGADVPGIEVDPTGMEQILLNLAVNARDACPAGGTLVLATRRERIRPDHGARETTPLPPGEYAVLEVADDGSGMDEGTIDRIFEPFFTTKPLGRGTGLGLATVYGIVEQSGGSIEVQSAPGRGTTFTIRLPAKAGSGPDGSRAG